MHSTAINVTSRPGPGRSCKVDGLPLPLLPQKATRANPLPGGLKRTPQARRTSTVGSEQARAKAGERLWSSGNASAHATQYAAGAVRTAACKPKPPRAAG